MDEVQTGDLQAGDVLLYSGTNWICKAIQFFDGSEWSHAALYLGGGQVGEAISEGLVRRDVQVGIDGNPRVEARRLKDAPPDYAPLLTRATHYLDQGNRYGYEQLLLLAFLCLARKLKLTPVLRRLVRAALDAAASQLSAYAKAGKEPMICSEFVYRAYAEALPGEDDPFDLRITEPLTVDASGALAPSGTRALAGGAAAPARPRGQGVHPQSLLAFLAASPSAHWIPSSPASLRQAEHAPSRGAAAPLDTLIEQYLGEARAVRAPAPRRATRAAAADVSMEDLRAATDRFAQSWYAATRPAEAAPARGAALEAAPAAAYAVLTATAADFVTPRDLSVTPSLFLLGRLKG